MTTNELGSRMYHNVGSVLNRTEQERSSKGIVYNHRNAMPMCYFRYSLDVGDIRIRIAEGFYKHRFGIRADSGFQSIQIVDTDNGMGDALCGKRMCNEVV